MYIPPPTREENREKLFTLMKQNSFGLMVTAPEGVPFASHLPFEIDAESGEFGTLRTHLARANPQWEHLQAEIEVLAIFAGEHAYVSPTYYVSSPNVPTWNYAAVHVYGTPRLLTDDELRPLLRELTAQYEPPDGWNLNAIPTEYVEKLSRAIVGVEIAITRLEGKWKMSQNKSEADRQSVIAALEAQSDSLARTVATTMRTIEHQKSKIENPHD
jgi:transcriptional regulator